MPIYLDHNATTPVDERVLEVMLPWYSGAFGNASSVHRYGRLARSAIDAAREQIARSVNVAPNQVLFTSGGTEANNLALQGVAAASACRRLVLSPTDHPCVVEPAEALQKRGWQLDWLPVSEQGLIQAADVEQALAQPAALLSVMLANNETGVIQDVKSMAGLAAKAKVPLHCDAVQALGKMPLDFADLGLQFMSLSSHKIYGPKGVGALVLDPALDIKALMQGGGQEQGLRPGTENVAAIVGFGAAAELAVSELEQRGQQNQQLMDLLDAGLAANPKVTVFADGVRRLNNTRQLALSGWQGEALLMELDRRGLAVSSGSACHSGSGEPSHVLMAMGIDRDLAYGAIRISLGSANTAADIETLLAALAELGR